MKKLLAVASMLGVGLSVPIDLTKMELCTQDSDCRVFGDERAYCNIPDATKRAFNGEITTATELVALGAGTVGQCTCGQYTAAEGLGFNAFGNIAHCFPAGEAAAVTNARTLLVSLNLRYPTTNGNCNTKSYLPDFEDEARRVITRHTTGMQITVACGTRYNNVDELYITISANMTVGEITSAPFLAFQDTLEARFKFNSMYFIDTRGMATGTVEFHSQNAMFMRCEDITNTTYWSYHGSYTTNYGPTEADPMVDYIVTTQRCISHACVSSRILVNGDCFSPAVAAPSDDDLTGGEIAAISIIGGAFVICIICIIVWCCCFREKYRKLPEEKEN